MEFIFSNKKEVEDPAVALVSFAEGKDNQVILLPTGQKSISIGVGKKSEVTLRKFIILIRQIVTTAKANKVKRLAIDFKSLSFPKARLRDKEKAQIVATNFEMASFEFNRFKSPPEEGWNTIDEVIIYGKNTAEIRKGIIEGQTIGVEVNGCRNLSNTPGGEMTPDLLAQEAIKASKNLPIKVTVLKKPEIAKLKMGGIIGVSQGSSEDPRFIIMEYRGGAKSRKPIVLVGKGITFDTGGLNLKPGNSINEMHMDMSGGAAVIHTITLAARLKLKRNIISLIPAAENMPSGSSYRPGDILRSMSGKTIEIGNTDAEGRVVLADALTYAKKYDPQVVVDVATLTGAAVVALGQRASAIFSQDKNLVKLLADSGEKSGDYAWPLPLWDEYDEDIKGTFGDVSNTGKTRWGGAITAAAFLKQFADGYKWAHIDIAPRMTSVEGEYLAQGAAGAGVRLLINFLQKI